MSTSSPNDLLNALVMTIEGRAHAHRVWRMLEPFGHELTNRSRRSRADDKPTALLLATRSKPVDDDEVASILTPNIEERADMWMIQTRLRPSFTLEPFARILTIRQV